MRYLRCRGAPTGNLGEVRQEGGGGNCACAGRADVWNVGKVGFELVFVGFKERQLPCFVVHVAGSGQQAVDQILIGCPSRR